MVACCSLSSATRWLACINQAFSLLCEILCFSVTDSRIRKKFMAVFLKFQPSDVCLRLVTGKLAFWQYLSSPLIRQATQSNQTTPCWAKDTSSERSSTRIAAIVCRPGPASTKSIDHLVKANANRV